MNSGRGDFCVLGLGLTACFCLAWGVSDAVAQEWVRPSEHGASRSLVLRGQDPEHGEVREMANPFEDHLETDRDSFTPSTRTVEDGRWIAESSYSFIDNRDVADTHSFPELLARYGLTDGIEFRCGGNYEVGGEGADVSGAGGTDGLHGGGLVQESQLLYGLKARLSNQDHWLPESSLILQGHTPTSGLNPATAFTAGYVFGWEFPDEWKLDSAIRFGADSEHGDRFEAWAPSIVLRKALAERWAAHAEYFGSFSQNKEHDFSHPTSALARITSSRRTSKSACASAGG